MSDISDAQEGDIYTDDVNKLWRVTVVVHEPTVTVEEVEGTLHDPNRPQHFQVPGGGIGLFQGNLPQGLAEIRKAQRSKPTGDPLWRGWTRIWRRPTP